jgi:hypothetical protein
LSDIWFLEEAPKKELRDPADGNATVAGVINAVNGTPGPDGSACSHQVAISALVTERFWLSLPVF